MNAAKQAQSVELVSKIASLRMIFRMEFIQAVPDFNPWLNDSKNKSFTDPNSIDISFLLPKQDFALHRQCVLIQIHFSEALLAQNCRIIGIEATGHNYYRGKLWYFSTVGNWQFEGVNQPISFCKEKLRRFAKQVFILFENPINLN